MANEEHAAKLYEGAEEWNKWRKENPDVRPGLSNSDLLFAIFFMADPEQSKHPELRLFRAGLRSADLSGADLRGAFLFGADLSGAKLSGSNLSGAHLQGYAAFDKG